MKIELTINQKLKIARVTLGVKIVDITNESELTRNAVYHLESSDLEKSSLIKYLRYFRSKGIDINTLV